MDVDPVVGVTQIDPGIAYFHLAETLCIDLTKVRESSPGVFKIMDDIELMAYTVRYVATFRPNLKLRVVRISGLDE
jgi:hypothetical protein